MRKIVASVGLVAIGVSGIRAGFAQEIGADTSKPWSVAASFRGFYDDNPGTVPDNGAAGQKPEGSWGFEISPSVAFAWTMEQTTISAGYLYSLRYYETKPPGSADHDDQTHTFNVALSHAFSERFSGRVADSFVIGQEPDTLRAGNTFATFSRLSGDNIRNYGSIGFDGQLTPEVGVSVGYDNAYYDYEANTPAKTQLGFLTEVLPSIAGTLNRIENSAHVEGLYRLQPQTRVLAGYRYHDIDYNGDEFISGTLINPLGPVSSGNIVPGTGVRSDDRNDREHTLYVGAMQSFSPDLSGSLRIGGSYVDYYNSSESGSTWSPYVDLSMRWTYMPESYIEGGFSYDRSASDVVQQFGVANGQFTQDAEAATVYASVNHRITPKLYASVNGQFQNSAYNGGVADGQDERYYLVGLNLEYRFTRNFSADVGYNYDKLDSDLGRTYDRNRVYFGITARY